MEETSNSSMANLRNNYGGFKQLAFWDKFAIVVFAFNVMAIICGVAIGVFLICTEMDAVGDAGAVSLFITVLIGIIVGAVLIFFQYLLLMFIQLFLSFLYDIKLQRIALENLTLIKGGEALDNRTIETFATISELESMNIDSSDVVK